MNKLEDYVVELAKIKGNPLKYYFPLVKISDPKHGTVDFQLWPHLVTLIIGFLKHKLIIVIKSRQIGLSWLIAAYAVWVALTHPNARILLISIGERESYQLLAKCKFIYRHLPEWLQFPLSRDSASELGFKHMESTIMALPSTEAAGRGEAGTLVLPDEWDYHEFAETNFAAIKPTIDAGGQLIGVTTVNKEKPDSFVKNLYKGAREGTNNFIPYFFPYDVRPGRDEAWYEDIKREYSDAQREQEYPRTIEEALSPLAARSFFFYEDSPRIQKLLDGVEEPTYETGHIWIYREPKVGVKYVAGGDVGEGIGEDFSTLTILGREGLRAEVAAVICANVIPTDIFAYEVDKLCRRYFNALLGMENNSLGLAVMNKLLELKYPNLFSSGKKEKPGITTGDFNRTTFLSELAQNIKNGSVITRCKPQILQMVEFTWDLSRKVNRPEGGKHDDLVISLSLANQMLKHQHVISGVEPVIYV